MSAKFIYLLILIILFGAFVGITSYINKENENGRIKLMSAPSAGVFIDGTATTGRTPFEKSLRPGDYTIKLIPEGIASNTATWEGKVKIYKGALTYVNRELASSEQTSSGEILTITKMTQASRGMQYGEVFIETDPIGAIVYIDNEEKGVSPLTAEILSGPHEVSVYLPGFTKRTKKISLDEGGYRINANFKLALEEGQKKLDDIKKIMEIDQASKSADLNKNENVKIIILDTPTGYLRVRKDPSIDSEEITRVKPQEEYQFIEEKNGWTKIKVQDDEGWVSSDYINKK